MTRVLVTGAAGFIGRWAARDLVTRGFEVHGTVRHHLDVAEGVTPHRVDLLDRSQISALIVRLRPEHLLICGWCTEHGAFWTDPANDTWSAATIALSECFYGEGGQRIVLAGTCAEYDWTDSVLADGPVAEFEAQGSPQTPYGRAKRKTADAIAALAARVATGFAVGRVFFPMGWGEAPARFLPSVVRAVLEGRPARLGSGDQVRDVMDVRDVGAALAALIDSDVAGPVNIGSGEAITLAEVARRAADSSGRADLLHFGALPARVGEPRWLVANNARLHGEVGFVPSFRLEDTIRSSFDYWADRTQAKCLVNGRRNGVT